MIHPTAILSPSARIGPNVRIGPFCVVGDGVEIGEGCTLHSHVVIDGITRIGAFNEFFPFAAIGGKTQDLKYEGEPTHLEIGDRNVFRENTTVHRGTHAHTPTHIGNDNLFLAYSHVAHDCQLGNHIILSNAATLGGHVEVDDHAIISGLAAVHQFCRVGRHSMIGGCARVTQDIPPFMIAEGHPAATRALNSVGLQRRGFSEDQLRSLKNAYKKLFLKRDNNLATAASSLRATITAHDDEVRHLLDFIESSKRGIAR